MKIVFLGLSITSSWGNGHATTYRGLIRELARRGHEILFLERDVPWYAENRDLPQPDFCRLALYRDRNELRNRHAGAVRDADVVVVGSYVPEGVAVGDWVLEVSRGAAAFYDIDTPVTLSKLARGDFEYLHPRQIPRYDLYLSFCGGPALEMLERHYGSPVARAFYCSFDPELYQPVDIPERWLLGYLGTYSGDRQPPLEQLLMEPARQLAEGRFAVAGPQYPPHIVWPENVERIQHLPPPEHARFYSSQRFTLNITRADMIRAGWSPSVRLFEAAACGLPIISDRWAGIETLLEPGREILLAGSTGEVVEILRSMPEKERAAIGAAARKRVMAEHTAAHRAQQLEEMLQPPVSG